MTDHQTEQHTALPWHVDRHGCIKGGIFREYTNGSSQDQIAMVCIPGDNNGTQGANSKLIVAAVNAYPANQSLQAAAEKALAAWDIYKAGGYGWEDANDAMADLRAVLNQQTKTK